MDIEFCGKIYSQNKNGTYLNKDSCISFVFYNNCISLRFRATQQRLAKIWYNSSNYKNDQEVIDDNSKELIDRLAIFVTITKEEYEKAKANVEKIENEFDTIFILN